MKRFSDGDRVKIHSLGPDYQGEEFKAIVRGIAIDDVVRIYIVQIVDKFDKYYAYSHCTMTESCLKAGW